MSFTERLENLLKSKKITQTELAQRLNIRRASISEWKRYNTFPYADIAVKIAEALETTVEYLVTGTPPAGLSIEALDLAQKFSNLSPSGQKAAQSMMEGLLQDYPRQPMQVETPAG
jgi:transcriptional regulator with XRE-family HTH domain